ncbi:hypothetical protein, partial [Enterobacter cloacae complex sp. CH23B]|uniref:hypothetical protein n=1 Tax=Enterobacter cloacae complex sp. CH23B TaxID=2511986 RepID=UPI001027F9CD
SKKGVILTYVATQTLSIDDDVGEPLGFYRIWDEVLGHLSNEVDEYEGIFLEDISSSEVMRESVTLDECIWDGFLANLVEDATSSQCLLEEENVDLPLVLSHPP